MSKKVLGLSFGRKMNNCDVMVKTALMECEKEGHEVKFIRVDELDIRPCTGCIACVIGLVSGRGKGECHIKDDFHILDEAIMEADGLIIASPTYVLSPTGQFKTVCDRIGPSHDVTFREATFKQGLEEGKDLSDLPDKRSFKPKVGALISVGGAMTKNWLSFMLPTMYEITLSMGVDVVDIHEYYGAMAHEHVLGNDEEMKRMMNMGNNIAQALNAQSPEERTKWRGEEDGNCPVCHTNMLIVDNVSTKVECPVCGIEGYASIVDNKLVTTFSQEQQKRSRLFAEGKWEHSNEIKKCAVGPGQIKELKALKEKYIGYGE